MLIFQSFFVHRLRDVNDDIRAMCSAYIGDWLRLDPGEWYKDEYLKYLGWMCADHCNKVRLETIGSVAKLIDVSDVEHLSMLRKFFDRHLERFVEIITQDIDPAVSLSATKLLCELQSRGVLTDDSEQLVDRVDGLIFDKEAPLELRCEVFSFFRGHAIGFEDPVPEKGAKRGSRIDDFDNDDEARAALSMTITRQKNALQLKTLCEFAKYHLVGKSCDGAATLAEVCLQSPICHVLLDWSTIVSMLLEDSQSAESQEEPGPELICYLLPMFLYSAQALHADKTKAGISGDSSSSKSRKAKDKPLSPSGIAWAALTDQLNKDLCGLLLRYRDNSQNVNCLLGLLDLYDIADLKTFKALLKVVVDLLHSSPSEDSRRSIVSAMRKWSTQDASPGVVQASAAALSALYSRLWGEICQDLGTISSGKKMSDDDLREHLCALSSAASKFSLLWKHVDCRKYLVSGDGPDGVVDVLARASRFVTDSFRSGEVYRLFGYEHEQLCTLASSCALAVYSLVLWNTRDGVIAARANAKEDDETMAQVVEELADTIESVTETRRRLLDELLLDWMALSQEEVPDHVDRLLQCADWKKFPRGGHYDKKDPFAAIWEASGLLCESELGVEAARAQALATKELWLLHRTLPREAFRMVGDLRAVFNQGNFHYQILDRFVWTPSEEVNSVMKRVFEGEGGRIAQDLERCPEDKQQSLSNIISTFLIQPMSYAFYIDSEGMNRRQASAVICYLLNNDESIVQHVKLLVRTLQQNDFQKSLEVDIGALQAIYTTKVERLIDEYERGEADDRTYFDDKELLAGFESVTRLAKILASLLLDMDHATRAKKPFARGMNQLFQAVASISLSHRRRYCFLAILENFLPLLSSRQRAEVSDDVVSKLNELEDFEGDLAYIGSLSSKLRRRLWKVVTEFQSFSSAELNRGGKKRSAMQEEEEEEEEDGSGGGEEEEGMDLAGPLRGLAVSELSNKQISLGRFAEEAEELDEDEEEMEEDAVWRSK